MNIVLIALDTQRADHLGCYGYPKATSPFLDSIAARGVVFEREQLTSGINLATLPTPMLKQAQLVAQLSRLRSNLHNSRWREIQVPQANDPSLPSLLKTMDVATDNLAKARRDAAQPRAHTFTLTPK